LGIVDASHSASKKKSVHQLYIIDNAMKRTFSASC
jgi:hypothetical protein